MNRSLETINEGNGIKKNTSSEQVWFNLDIVILEETHIR